MVAASVVASGDGAAVVAVVVEEGDHYHVDSSADHSLEQMDEKTKGSLGKWFREKWVDISRTNKDGSHPPCGASAGKKSRKGGQRAYPKCRKKSVADRMTKKEKKNAVARKRKHYGSKGRPKKKAILQK